MSYHTEFTRITVYRNLVRLMCLFEHRATHVKASACLLSQRNQPVDDDDDGRCVNVPEDFRAQSRLLHTKPLRLLPAL
jgi:hypothetical protein